MRKTKRYRVLVEGANVVVRTQSIERLGFYTTRFVEAEGREDAVGRAIDSARQELLASGAVLNAKDDPPIFRVSEITQLASFRGVRPPGQGFTFFPEDET